MNSTKHFWFPALFVCLMLLVGALYVGPLVTIAQHLRRAGQSFVFSYESYRNDLTYLTRAREVYDGHAPSSDPFSDGAGQPTLRNPIPSVLFAGFLLLTRGDTFRAYLAALFVFSQVSFFLFYLLGLRLFGGSRRWALFFALVGVLTPIALRILNFSGTA